MGCLLLGFGSSTLFAAEVPHTLTFQGTFSDTHGLLSGDKTVTIKIYAGANLTSAVWQETHSVSFVNGQINVSGFVK